MALVYDSELGGYYDDGNADWYDYTPPEQDTSNFDVNQFYADYENAGGWPSEDEQPTEKDVIDYMNKGTSGNSWLNGLGKALGDTAKDAFKKYIFDSKTGKVNLAGLATLGTGLYSAYKSMSGQDKSGGYNKPVPKMEAVRQVVQYDDTNRRPGSAGRQYFTDMQFTPAGESAAARQAATTQAAGLKALQPAAQPQTNPYAGKMPITWNQPAAPAPAPAAAPATPLAVPTAQQVVNQGGIQMAHGGLAHLAAGGRYLDGATDGMADEINTTIDGEQPAKLSHGEFVIPADVVSHLGNGNSDAGAKKLYEMMARVRKARTGNEEQGRQINPDSFMPGGKVGYASGGAVRFDAGGNVSTAATTATAPTSPGIPLDTSKTSSLSPWVGEYVTNALGQGAALANSPYQAYTGPLTAGASGLQQQAFAGSSELAQAGYQPTQFQGGLFNLAAANQYMNPYLQASLDPQLKELQRQNQILNMEAAGKAARSGAYGGSRQALVQTENQRNLLDKMSGVIGQGYNTAYDKAAAQFNADQARQMEAQKATEASRQYGSEFGLKSLSNLANMGQTQRDIEQQGIAADKAQFEEQRDWAYKMPQYQLNLLSNLPIGTTTSSTDTSGLPGIMQNISGLGSMYKTINEALGNLGVTPTTPAKS